MVAKFSVKRDGRGVFEGYYSGKELVGIGPADASSQSVDQWVSYLMGKKWFNSLLECDFRIWHRNAVAGMYLGCHTKLRNAHPRQKERLPRDW